MAEQDKDEVRKDFDAAVNMAPVEIEKWLRTDESKKVGYKAGGRGESVGHASGYVKRHVVSARRTL